MQLNKAYFSTYKVTVLVTEDSFIVLEDTVAKAGTHEVVVALARRKAATYRCSSSVTSFTALWKESWNISKAKHYIMLNRCKYTVCLNTTYEIYMASS